MFSAPFLSNFHFLSIGLRNMSQVKFQKLLENRSCVCVCVCVYVCVCERERESTGERRRGGGGEGGREDGVEGL